jgi:hypothetical protein
VVKLLTKEQIIDFIHSNELSRKEILYTILWTDKENPQSIEVIRQKGIEFGIPEIKNWNLTDYFRKAKPFVAKFPEGYILSSKGKKHIEELLPKTSHSTKTIAHTLQSYVVKIQDNDTKYFLEEAIRCLEFDLYRASVVLSWVGSLSLLYDFVVNNKLVDFNSEALRRDNRWRNAKTKDDLTKMKESDFLDVLVSISVLGKNVKEQLKKCLDLRNACGHPNSLKIGKHNVESHLETLILNVFQKF